LSRRSFPAAAFGKTHLANKIAHSAASGEPCFKNWTVPEPVRTLVIDGEMPASVLKERFAAIAAGSQKQPAPGFLRILAADLCSDGIPNLSTPAGQKVIEPLLQDVDFLQLDNLSSLAATSRDNDADSWSPVQEWLLRLRRRGKSVLLVHHAGKGGQQRGSSRREDILDTVIALRRPSDYVPTEGARFEIHIEKGRHVFGDEAKPFEAKLEVRDGAAMWTMRDLADVDMQRVIDLAREGLSVRDISDETGLSKSTVQRLKTKAVEAGLVGAI
jgi:putative DNA primase/helicase